eukprot:TRINITY_DN12511_c1_g2_i3.p1 TRINITY_DN12511_c1_g2~~TRINITY_DN12511_c1_g2_i3.p1  ORF type:complete len:788 (+),score=71.55 TRINITY_DN12511_c1_g2_i3:117-2480(+)
MLLQRILLLVLCIFLGLCYPASAGSSSPCLVAALDIPSSNLTCSQTGDLVSSGTLCKVNCIEHNHLFSAYTCMNGRWYADHQHGSICPYFQECSLSLSAIVCDRCGRPDMTSLRHLPKRLSAGLTTVIFRCHAISEMLMEPIVDIGTDLKYLDVSRNQIVRLHGSVFFTSPNLEYLNLSHNYISVVSPDGLPYWQKLRVLDLSYNRIFYVFPAAFSAVFPADCATDVVFESKGNRCNCSLVHRPPSCNNVYCDCEVPLNVSCDFVNGSSLAPAIPASYICDGIADCPDCSDERACKQDFNFEVRELLSCIGSRVTISIQRGIGIIYPASFETQTCRLMPHAEFMAIPIAPLFKGSPIVWKRDTEIGGLAVNINLFFASSSILSMQSNYTHLRSGIRSSAVQQNFQFANECPLFLDTLEAPELTNQSATSNRVLIASLSSGGAVLFLILAVCVLLRRRQRRVHLQSVQSGRKSLQRTINELITDLQYGRQLDDSSISKLPLLARATFASDEVSLGSGYYGKVVKVLAVKAQDEIEAHEYYAMKMLDSIAEEQTDQIQDVIFEACIMHSLQHCHIVAIYGIIEDELPLSIVMELAPLGSLRPLLTSRGASIPQSNKLEMLAQCASALAHVHSYNLIHRDIAARNVLVWSLDSPLVKLADFGLGRKLGSTQEYYRSTSSDAMPFRWMAPEALSKGKFSFASDVWSFGVLMWEVLHNVVTPYANLPLPKVLQLQQKGRRLPISGTITLGRLHDIFKSCWQTEPGQRPTMKAVELSLLKAVGETSRIGFYEM